MPKKNRQPSLKTDDLRRMDEDEALLEKETKPVLERKKLAAEIVNLRGEREGIDYQNSLRERRFAQLEKVATIIAVLIGFISALVALVQYYDSTQTQEITKFNTAFDDATDSTKGGVRRAAGVYALAEYLPTQPCPVDWPADQEWKNLQETEQRRVASALTAVMISDEDKATFYERNQAALAIIKAFSPNGANSDNQEDIKSKKPLSELLFGEASKWPNTGEKYPWGTLTFADYELYSEWQYYRSSHTKVQAYKFYVGYSKKMTPMELVFSFCHQYLQGTSFYRCYLGNCHLEEVHLQGADLRYANFDSSSLKGAQFQHAHLDWANLNNTDISGANFTAATIDGARFENVKGIPVLDHGKATKAFQSQSAFKEWALENGAKIVTFEVPEPHKSRPKKTPTAQRAEARTRA